VTSPERPISSASTVPSIVAADMTVTGDIASDGEVLVDGTVHGDIVARALTVGEGAVIRGEIKADTLRVCGAVTGLLKGREVVLTRTARVEGDIYNEVLSIEAGAQLEGMCRRLHKAEALSAPETLAIPNGVSSAGLGPNETGGSQPH
jgi:cytoskeletal protein CcmA (bactofilin family)